MEGHTYRETYIWGGYIYMEGKYIWEENIYIKDKYTEETYIQERYIHGKTYT